MGYGNNRRTLKIFLKNLRKLLSAIITSLTIFSVGKSILAVASSTKIICFLFSKHLAIMTIYFSP